MRHHFSIERFVDDIYESFALSQCIEINAIVRRSLACVLEVDIEPVSVRADVAGTRRDDISRVGDDESQCVDSGEACLRLPNGIGVESVRLNLLAAP